jgi:hypothetical protein
LLSGLILEANVPVCFLPVFRFLPEFAGIPIKDQVFSIVSTVELEGASGIEIVQRQFAAVEAEYLSGDIGNVMRIRGLDGME